MHSNDAEEIRKRRIEPEDNRIFYTPNFPGPERKTDLDGRRLILDSSIETHAPADFVDVETTDLSDEGKNTRMLTSFQIDDKVRWENGEYLGILKAIFQKKFKRDFMGFRVLEASLENPLGRRHPTVHAYCSINLRY